MSSPSVTSTTRPLPRRTSRGSTACSVIRWVSRPLRSARRPLSRSCSHSGFHSIHWSPPQVSSTSTSSRPPCSPSIRRARASTSDATRWSQRTAMPWPPALVTSSAVSSIVSGRSSGLRECRVVRPVTYTVAPPEPSSTAMPLPAPRVPPVTSATCPCSGPLMMSSPPRSGHRHQQPVVGPEAPHQGTGRDLRLPGHVGQRERGAEAGDRGATGLRARLEAHEAVAGRAGERLGPAGEELLLRVGADLDGGGEPPAGPVGEDDHRVALVEPHAPLPGEVV